MYTIIVNVCLHVVYIIIRTLYAGCKFKYTQQPPSHVTECNPFMMMGGHYKIKISLECTVHRETSINDKFEIRWFMENTLTGRTENLGQGNYDQLQNNMIRSSRYHNTKLFNQQYNPSFVGKYWCQVINTTADPDQPLMRSNVFTLLPPENYTEESICSDPLSIQIIDNETCADLPMTNQSDQTSKPVPDTTISSTPPAVIMSTTTQQTTTVTTSIWNGNVASFVSAPSTTPLVVPSTGQQTLLAVVASVGGVLLIIAIILVVVIAVVLTMKKKKIVSQIDQKGGVVHILYVINLLLHCYPQITLLHPITCTSVHWLWWWSCYCSV